MVFILSDDRILVDEEDETEMLGKPKVKSLPDKIVIHNRGPKRQSVPSEALKPCKNSTATNKPADSRSEFNLKRARHEVLRYGIAGLGTEEKQKAKLDLLIKLGAKPPKKLYVNYKELQEQKKGEKLALKQRIISGEWRIPKLNGDIDKQQTRRKKRDRNDVGRLDGQIGRFKRGVQLISKKDIRTVNKKRKTAR